MNEKRKPYPFDRIEPKWQAIWAERGTFRTPNPGDADFDPARPKFYVLDMFPYPSGSGLHVGHPEGYTATDIIARYKRMRGFNVLHPMGWDAFGLPAEQHAIKTGEHPRINTAQNVANFKRQLNSLGFNYDWSREVNTTDPGYFRWTQWIFRLLYESWFNPATKKAEPISTYTGSNRDGVRLAFVSEAPVNWCAALGTVLANEEVVDGKSEVGGYPVERRPMRQWMPQASATSPIRPPSASTSRTRCPLAMPPMAGLQLICAMRSSLRVKSAVRRPMRAAAAAASQPAWPAPTTTTSKCCDSLTCPF